MKFSKCLEIEKLLFLDFYQNKHTLYKSKDAKIQEK